jgi:hypothetical protein
VDDDVEKKDCPFCHAHDYEYDVDSVGAMFGFDARCLNCGAEVKFSDFFEIKSSPA